MHITSIKYPLVNPNSDKCPLKRPVTEPLLIRDSDDDGNPDYIQIGGDTSPTLIMDTDNDGYWDVYDTGGDAITDLIIDKEFGTTITNEWCRVSSIDVSLENEDKYDDEQNFCYSKPQTGTRIAIFVGVIIADTILEVTSAGLLTHVAVGLTGGALYVASQQYEKWP